MTTIADLLKLVPEGETRLFTGKGAPPYPERFRSIHMNWDYDSGRLTWENSPEMEKAPWLGSRKTERIPIKNLKKLDVKFAGPVEDIVDLYSTGSHAYFISPELLKMIDALDGNSLERKAAVIKAEDGLKDYFIVMVDRKLDVIDPKYTDVIVKYKKYGNEWMRSVEFPNSIVINQDIPKDIHMFSTCDVFQWYWSNELIQAVEKGGMRGITIRSPRKVVGSIIKEL